jgi:hypothetical protein
VVVVVVVVFVVGAVEAAEVSTTKLTVEVDMPVELAAVTLNAYRLSPSGSAALPKVTGEPQANVPPNVQVTVAVGSLTLNTKVMTEVLTVEPSVGPEVKAMTGAFGPVETVPPVGMVVEAVVVVVVLAGVGCTKKVLVATRPLVTPIAVSCVAPLWLEVAVNGVVKFPLASVVTVEVATPTKPTLTCSAAAKLVPNALKVVPEGPLKLLKLRKA